MSIQTRTLADGSTRYLARYRGPDGKQHSRTFRRKGDARSWLAEQDVAQRRGTWIDPQAGCLLVREWIEIWEPTQLDLRLSSRDRDASLLRARILPRWGDLPLNAIDYDGITSWVASLVAEGLAPGTVHKIVATFSKALDSAVRSRRIPANPVRGVKLPKDERQQTKVLTPDQIAALADAIAPQYRAFVLLGAYCGLRFGELAGLRWRQTPSRTFA